MTPNEIAKIIKIASWFGINKVKITGGEPLLRHDLSEIIYLISKIKSIEDISLVTSARILTYKKALEMKNKGLTRINVNLPSLKEEIYRKIVGLELKPAIDGIKAALRSGLYPVKINMVLLKGLNDLEVPSMINFAKENKAILQLIELEPLKMNNETYKKYFMPLEEIESWLSKESKKVVIRETMQNRRIYTLKNNTKVEFVRPVDNTEFCLHCTRIRLTNSGKLKPCLMSNNGLVDILGPIRRGDSEIKLRELFLRAVKLRKPYYTEQEIHAIVK